MAHMKAVEEEKKATTEEKQNVADKKKAKEWSGKDAKEDSYPKKTGVM